MFAFVMRGINASYACACVRGVVYLHSHKYNRLRRRGRPDGFCAHTAHDRGRSSPWPSYHTGSRETGVGVREESSLGEGGEADGVVVEGEGGIDVLHERVAEEPDVAAEAEVHAGESADALAGSAGGLTKVEANRRRRISRV